MYSESDMFHILLLGRSVCIDFDYRMFRLPDQNVRSQTQWLIDSGCLILQNNPIFGVLSGPPCVSYLQFGNL
jgi:hypothetical protein